MIPRITAGATLAVALVQVNHVAPAATPAHWISQIPEWVVLGLAAVVWAAIEFRLQKAGFVKTEQVTQIQRAITEHVTHVQRAVDATQTQVITTRTDLDATRDRCTRLEAGHASIIERVVQPISRIEEMLQRVLETQARHEAEIEHVKESQARPWAARRRDGGE